MAALAVLAHNAVGSYLGLTINIIGDTSATLTAPADGLQMTDIRASLRMPLLHEGIDGVGIEFVLYAHQLGAFVDLAADLAWLRGGEAIDFVLDQHLQLPLPTERDETLLATSLINQAIGVLIGRGSTPDAAVRELDFQAAGNAITRVGAASRLLAALPARGELPAERRRPRG